MIFYQYQFLDWAYIVELLTGIFHQLAADVCVELEVADVIVSKLHVDANKAIATEYYI